MKIHGKKPRKSNMALSAQDAAFWNLLYLILFLKCSIMPLRYVVFFRALTTVNYNLVIGFPSAEG